MVDLLNASRAAGVPVSGLADLQKFVDDEREWLKTWRNDSDPAQIDPN